MAEMNVMLRNAPWFTLFWASGRMICMAENTLMLNNRFTNDISFARTN